MGGIPRMAISRCLEQGNAKIFNTSFNLFGEPLVSDPREAIRSFYCAGIDALAIGDFFIMK